MYMWLGLIREWFVYDAIDFVNDWFMIVIDIVIVILEKFLESEKLARVTRAGEPICFIRKKIH
jgi:hypothetical protein